MSNAKPAADGAKKKGKGRLLIVLVAAIVLALGGGGAAFFFFARGVEAKPAAGAKGADGEAGHDEEADDGHDPAVVPLPTFTVNLADPGSTRYLRTTLSLVIKDIEKAEALLGGDHKGEAGNVKVAMARSAVLELLTTKSSLELTTAEGKQALKKEIAEKAGKALKVKVNDVLFAEFVVQ
jgi:flagellar FliL protein